MQKHSDFIKKLSHLKQRGSKQITVDIDYLMDILTSMPSENIIDSPLNKNYNVDGGDF